MHAQVTCPYNSGSHRSSTALESDHLNLAESKLENLSQIQTLLFSGIFEKNLEIKEDINQGTALRSPKN